MAWVRIDDGMPDSLKVAPLSDAAFRAYVTSICYCARSLSDGFVPAKKAKEFSGRPRVVQELTDATLWESGDGGFTVHDYLEYNPTRETVLAERDKAKARMKVARSADVRPNIDGSSPSPTPTRPTPHPLYPDPVLKPSPQPPTAGEVAEMLSGRPLVLRLYDQLFGAGRINDIIRQRLLEVDAEFSDECITHCFQEAASANARSWNLVDKILLRHQAEGCFSGNGNGKGRGESAAGADPAGVAVGVSNLDRLRAAVAARERGG